MSLGYTVKFCLKKSRMSKNNIVHFPLLRVSNTHNIKAKMLVCFSSIGPERRRGLISSVRGFMGFTPWSAGSKARDLMVKGQGKAKLLSSWWEGNRARDQH